jgi:hypothetical protein
MYSDERTQSAPAPQTRPGAWPSTPEVEDNEQVSQG